MDILYIIGKDSAESHDELRYSLRGIEKNGINIGRVFLVGTKPEYVNNKIEFIPCSDIGPSKFKHCDMLNKIKKVCLETDISNDFLVSSDDHFYIKPTDFDNYPYFCKEELTDTYNKGKCSKNGYFRAMDATYFYLQEKGLPIHNFAWHGNTHFNKEKFIDILEMVDECISEYWGCEPTCLMLNAMCADKKYEFPITRRGDLKIFGTDSLVYRLKERPEMECFSLDDESYIQCNKDWLQSKFKHKSKYEW